MLTAAKCIKLFKEKGYKFNREEAYRPYNLNIVGFRRKESRPNYFDDIIGVFYEERGQWVSNYFEATTLPGIPYLLNPINSKGTAILIPGQYQSYSLGKHKGYPALVQTGAVRVYRDNNKDLNYDEVSAEKGFFGINIHRASLGALLVGTNSAGCQVIKNRSDYEKFIELCKKYKEFHGLRFTYTLVEI